MIILCLPVMGSFFTLTSAIFSEILSPSSVTSVNVRLSFLHLRFVSWHVVQILQFLLEFSTLSHLSFCVQLAAVMDGPGSPLYTQFEGLCCQAYLVLRRHGHLLLSLFNLMVAGGALTWVHGWLLGCSNVLRSILLSKCRPSRAIVRALFTVVAR